MAILMVVLWVLAVLCGMLGLVFFIIILVHAFKVDTGQGFLCLCVPLYILYFAFAKFEHPKKGLIIGLWLGSYVLQGALFWGAAFAGLQAGRQALDDFSIPRAPVSTQPGAYPVPPATLPATPFAYPGAPALSPGAIPVAPLPGSNSIPMAPIPAPLAAPPASALVPIPP